MCHLHDSVDADINHVFDVLTLKQAFKQGEHPFKTRPKLLKAASLAFLEQTPNECCAQHKGWHHCHLPVTTNPGADGIADVAVISAAGCVSRLLVKAHCTRARMGQAARARTHTHTFEIH